MDNVYNGSIITQEQKEKQGFLYIEQLVFDKGGGNIPRTIYERIDADIVERIETDIKCFYGISTDSKIVFKDYKHFSKTLKELETKLKNYTK